VYATPRDPAAPANVITLVWTSWEILSGLVLWVVWRLGADEPIARFPEDFMFQRPAEERAYFQRRRKLVANIEAYENA
jgi:hypothetical protein